MAQRTDEQLTTSANIIQSETGDKANTANRTGQMFNDLNDSKINNDKIDTAPSLDTLDKTIPGRDAIKAYIDALLEGIGVEHYRGDYAGTTAFPTSGGTGALGVPSAGDRWRLTGYLVVGSNGPYAPGTVIEAAVDNPGGSTRANWNIIAVQA